MTTIEKCFLLTGAFEGGGYDTLSGNFDGMGISFGFLQWNLGQGTLQSLLLSMYEAGPKTFQRCCTQPVAQFGGATKDLTQDLLAVCRMPKAEGVAWAAARCSGRYSALLPHWRAVFKALAAEPGFQRIQRNHANPYVNTAKGCMIQYGFESERALALFFDVSVQQGSVDGDSRQAYLATLTEDQSEETRLYNMAKCVGQQANPEWIQDVTQRKMTIALGRGTVHGTAYNLEQDFGITMGAVV